MNSVLVATSMLERVLLSSRILQSLLTLECCRRQGIALDLRRRFSITSVIQRESSDVSSRIPHQERIRRRLQFLPEAE